MRKPQHCLLAITGAYGIGGGIAAVNRLVIHALSDAGYQLTVIALNETPDAIAAYHTFANIRYTACSGSKLQFVGHILRALPGTKKALVFFDHVNLAFALAPLGALRFTRYAVFLHGVEVYAPLPDFEGRWGLRAAWKLLANSEHTKRKVQEQFPNKKVTLCDLALSPDQHFHADTSNIELPPLIFASISGSEHQLGGSVILSVGRMASGDQYKGQDTLILALPRILAAYPDAQLVLVGKGDDSERLANLAQSLPSDAQTAIFMPGYVSDELLQSLYRQCYVFAMPSWGEGFGLVYIEAMRWGKPCLGSRVDAAQSVIRDNTTGVLVDDPQSPVEVAERLIQLFREPETATKWGRAGAELVKEHYLYEHFKVRFLDALNLT